MAPSSETPASDTGAARSKAGTSTARRELVENEIFEHAARLFAERGFAGTSLQDIADAMGMTRPALYYYVRNKDDLLARLVTEITEGPASQLAAIAEGDGDAVERLREMVQLIVARRATDAVRFRLLVRSENDLPPELMTAHRQGRRGVLRSVASVLEEGVTTGAFRPVDARVAALAVLGMANWVAWWFDADGTSSHSQVADQLADMAVASLQRDDARVPAQDGPLGALAMLRQDLDHLAHLLEADVPRAD